MRMGLILAIVCAATLFAADPPIALTRLSVPPDALTNAKIEWFGVYFGSNKIGHYRTELRPTDLNNAPAFEETVHGALAMKSLGVELDMKYQERTLFSATPPYALLHKQQRIETDGESQTIEVARRDDGKYRAVIHENGETREFPVEIDYTFADYLTPAVWVADPARKEGDELYVRAFDFESLRPDPEYFLVTAIKHTVAGGVKTRYFELAMRSLKSKIAGTLTADAQGNVYESTIAGMFQIRLEPEIIAKAKGVSVDIFRAGMVKIDRPIGDPSQIESLVLRCPSLIDLPNTKGQQVTTVDGKSVLRLGQSEGPTVKVTAEARLEALRETPEHPIRHPKIAELVGTITAGKQNDEEKVRAILSFVDTFIEDSYTAEPLTVSHLLDKKQGDCTEHTMLFTTLARAAGIPSRDVSGLIYMGDEFQAFGGHAWNEVALDGHWVQIDATWGEFDINATHILFGHEMGNDLAVLTKLAGKTLHVVSVKPAPEEKNR